MKRIFIQIVGLVIMLSVIVLAGHTVITASKFPRYFQQEFVKTTEQLTIEDRNNYTAGKQDRLSSIDAILAKAQEVTTKSALRAYDARIGKLLSWLVGLFFVMIVTFLAPFFLLNKD